MATAKKIDTGYTRISKSRAIAPDGSIVKTCPKVVNVGAGRGFGAGKPREYDSADDFLKAFTDFNDYVVDNDFDMLPTMRNFAKWAGIDQRTVYNYKDKYFPESKKDYQQILSDTLTEGAIVGKYDKTMTIFCLKNWCDWADKREDKVEHKKTKLVTKAQAEEALKKYADTVKGNKSNK